MLLLEVISLSLISIYLIFLLYYFCEIRGNCNPCDFHTKTLSAIEKNVGRGTAFEFSCNLIGTNRGRYAIIQFKPILQQFFILGLL